MQARKKQGWSDKAKSYATPTTWSGGGKATPGVGSGGDGTAAGLGALTARSDATSAGALTARSGARSIKPLTLADEWRLRDFRFTAMELERVKTTPFHRLPRKELKARKLLGRFHDGQDTAPAEGLARASERRCAAVRAKDKAARTTEESEWVEIDKKIFPEFWRQKDRQEARKVPREKRDKQGYHQGQRARGDDPVADLENDKLRVRELLLAFNGPISTFAKERARWDSRKVLDGELLTMTSSKRIAQFVATRRRAVEACGRDNTDLGRPPGPDAKVIALLRELITAKAIDSKYMDTKAAHNTAQRFNTEHYAKELERDIASQLREQILERERAMVHETKGGTYEDASVSDSSDDDAENWETETPPPGAPLVDKVKRVDASFRGGPTGNSRSPRKTGKVTDSTRGAESQNFSAAARTRSSVGHGSTATSDKHSAPNFGGSGRGGSDWAKGEGEVQEKDASSWQRLPAVQEFTQEEVEDLIGEDPSWEGCRACLTIPCRWSSCVDYRSVSARKTQIRDELFRLIGLWDLDEVVTVLPLSCVRGGPTTLPRNEAISELRWEAKELDRQLHLAAVDKELHDAYVCKAEAIEVKSLHEYSTLMWTKDAQVALSKERELTLARTTTQEVVDDLLESMLDGWVFGERQAEHAAAGIIPAVKASDPLRPGDQRRAVAYLDHRHRLRRVAHAQGKQLPEEIKGTHHSKALPIDDIAQQRIIEGRASKKKEDQKHLLRETENTMKFGLFSMVQGYLHAMTLVKREKEAWSCKGDVMTKEGTSFRPPLTSERKKMVQEVVKARERAAAQKKFLDRARKAEDRGALREAKNKRRVSQRKAMRVLESREREKASRNIQRVFRGFRGRVFAQRWAFKRAEIEALKSVLHEAAVNIQRAYRGHLGRVEATEVRMELAEYIADIRVKEAESDIDDFWKTHKLKATKDEVKKKLLNTVGQPLLALRRRKLQ
ncbi:conserved unknown protein [Ectocarpus siliculosus]|uniref:IQ calmodulin-binding motif family protein n=1 Tax=Ectocarpus siliculosus TaxID=2880 RepID=D8LJN7_ECTSI|nr:conserved unknown protein [Ectocarpus siliculosus]|eukprot:CBN77064.1 conserved unknown protein [Ectocarpus siliculosus]